MKRVRVRRKEANQVNRKLDNQACVIAHLTLTFPTACDHILQRPQYRIEKVLERQIQSMKVCKTGRWIEMLVESNDHVCRTGRETHRMQGWEKLNRKEYEYTWSHAKTGRRGRSYELPPGKPALDFLGGVTSLAVKVSEKEAVLVGAGVWHEKWVKTKYVPSKPTTSWMSYLHKHKAMLELNGFISKYTWLK